MQPGDRLFLYSDGITECEQDGHDSELFGEQRLMNLLQSSASLPMRDMIERVWCELCQWRGSDTFDDDMTYLVMEYRGETE